MNLLGKKDFNPKEPINNLILYGYRGSIAHNMYIPSDDPLSIDDKDLMGVYIDTIDNYFGIPKTRNRGTKEITYQEYDIVLYEIRKMFSLWYKNNPNALSLLWLQDNHYLKKTYYGDLLICNKHLFSSKKIYKAFVGYAHGQLKRMTAFKKEGYMGEKRKSLIKKFGYDVKNAAHLIRILKMGIEFLATGELNVFRADASVLLEIKRGEWSLDQVKNEANRLFKVAEDALVHSHLQEKPNYQDIENLLIDILTINFKNNSQEK
jgi:predicted nucleotidyltransferase